MVYQKYIFLYFWKLQNPNQSTNRVNIWWKPASGFSDIHIISRLCYYLERKERRLCSLSCKGTNAILRAPLSWLYLILLTSQWPHLKWHIMHLELGTRIRAKHSITDSQISSNFIFKFQVLWYESLCHFPPFILNLYL